MPQKYTNQNAQGLPISDPNTDVFQYPVQLPPSNQFSPYAVDPITAGQIQAWPNMPVQQAAFVRPQIYSNEPGAPPLPPPPGTYPIAQGYSPLQALAVYGKVF